MTRPLVRVVFALLVVATIAAFLATQQLKSEFPLVIRFAAKPVNFSPNGDGVRDSTEVGFDLSEPARVTFSVMDQEGNEVRRLVTDVELAGDAKHRYRWDGRDDDGRLVPDGLYRMRVVRRDEGRVIDSAKEINVDRTPAPVTLTSAHPSVIAPGEPGQRPEVRIRYRGPSNQAPVFRIFRTDGEGPPRLVLRFRGGPDRQAVWDGRLREGRVAPEGDYAITVQVRDRAGNPTEAPAAIPSARQARAGTGVSVRRFTLDGPLDVVPAGAVVGLHAGPFDRSFDFVLSRLGSPSPIVRGQRIGGDFRVRVPRRARTGVYLVRARAGRRRAVWPLAVAGLPQTKGAAGSARPLVVLPTLTWQGLNPVDSDHDGFADVLPAARVPVERPFAGGALPPRFRSEPAPLLRFLDRAKLDYDLTTDVSLARRSGPALGNARGAVIAGSAIWLPSPLGKRLRSYVDGGGRVALLGADSLRRSAPLADGTFGPGGPPSPTDVFGERTAPQRTGAAPLDVFQDDLGLFDELSPLIGDFTLFERSVRLPAGAELLSAAGRELDQPAFVAYRLGDGLVLRTGTPQWSRELNESALSVEVPRATRRIWALLAGRLN